MRRRIARIVENRGRIRHPVGEALRRVQHALDQPGHQPDDQPREHEHAAHRDHHRRRVATRSGQLFLRLEVDSLAEGLGVLLPPAQEHAPAGPQQAGGGEDRGGEEHRDDPAVPGLDRRVLQQALARERAEERRRRDAQRADQKDRPDRPRHGLAETLELELVDAPAAVDHRADAHEQAGAQQPVGQHQQRGRGDALGRQQSHADEREADLAHRREREQPLEVVLGQAHHRAPQGRDAAEHEEDDRHPLRVRPQRPGEHRPIDAGDRVDAEIAHHAREDQADRGRGDGVGVGEPEVERHHRRLDHEPDRQARERAHNQAVRGPAREHLADLGEVQRARARVEQRDPEEDEHRPDRVGHGEHQRPLERSGGLHPVGGQRVRGDAHQLEEDEEVEEVARQQEARHRATEHEHHRVEDRPDGGEVAPREQEGRADQDGREQREAGRQRVVGHRDAQRDPLAGRPAAEERGHRPVAAHDVEEQRPDEHHAAGRGDDGDDVVAPPRERERCSEQGGDQERAGHDERGELLHVSRAAGRARRGRACRSASAPARRWPAAAR